MPMWDSNVFRFAIVAVCASVSFALRGDKWLLSAMCFTVLADACLLLLEWNEAGVAVFCLAQLSYVKRAGITWRRLRAAVFLLLIPSVLLVMRQPFLLCLSALYAQTLLFAIAATIRAWHTGQFGKWRGRLAAIGMLLFLGCDICVALYNLTVAGLNMPQLSSIAGNLIWLFYAPSQALLAVSAKEM